jgi:hypothetical protein
MIKDGTSRTAGNQTSILEPLQFISPQVLFHSGTLKACMLFQNFMDK